MKTRFKRFDLIVWLTAAGLGLLTGLFLWQGEHSGVAIITRTPAPDAGGVSTTASIQVMFDQAIDASPFGVQSFSPLPLPLILHPPATGTVRWQGTTLIFSPSVPLASETTYTVMLADTLKSLQGRAIEGERRWQFTTRRPYLLYLAPDQQGLMQLSVFDPTTGLAQRISQSASAVRNYAPAPDSATIAYAAANNDGGSDLWSLNMAEHESSRLVSCRQDRCECAAWFPDSVSLIYERTGIAEEHPRLWRLEREQGGTMPLFADSTVTGYGAGWSPDGKWLSYIDPQRGELHVSHLDDERHFTIPNQMGEPPVWHPRQNVLLFADVLFRGETMVVHVFRVDVEQGELHDISGEMNLVEDRFPTWSPDGSWLACVRKTAGTSMGKQLVMMRPDGGEFWALTQDVLYDHSRPVWSPDDRYIAFQRSSIQQNIPVSEIWLLDVTTGKAQQVAAPGTQPAWLP